VFINDQEESLVKKHHHFTDDATIKSSIEKDQDPSKPHKELQTDLKKKTEVWAGAWLVSINALEKKELLISKKRNFRAHPDFVFKVEAIT